MALFKLFFKFKSAKSFGSIPICGSCLSIGELKDIIFETKIGRGKDFDLVITNAETNEEYVDESTLIWANSSVVIRRIPGWPRKPIVLAPPPVEDENPELKEELKSTVKPAVFIYDSEEWDEFFASDSVSGSSTLSTVDGEDSKIRALVDTPAPATGGGGGRRMWGRNIPPEGYVCHRCKVAGHYIKHCPTNGDPDYHIEKAKAAIMPPDEAIFEKEIEGMPTIQSSVGDLPAELYCKICKKVMEYAVITSKCCFESFCDQCIRNYIISNKTMCVCGATNILTDHLLPNLTLRNTINRFLEYNNSTGTNVEVDNNDSTTVQIPYKAQVPSPGQCAASNEEAKIPSPMQSVASNKEEVQSLASNKEEAAVASTKEDIPVAVQGERAKKRKNEEGEGAKKKRKKAHVPSDDGKMQWIATQNYMMSMAFAAYNPYWTAGIQPGMEAFMTPGPYAGAFPCI